LLFTDSNVIKGISTSPALALLAPANLDAISHLLLEFDLLRLARSILPPGILLEDRINYLISHKI
jgi:hypothetical protein